MVIIVGAGYFIYKELTQQSEEEEAYQSYLNTMRLEKEVRRKRLNELGGDHPIEKELEDREEKCTISSTQSFQSPKPRDGADDPIQDPGYSFGQYTSNLTDTRDSSGLRHRSRGTLQSDEHPPLIDLRQQFYPPMPIVQNRSRSETFTSSTSNLVTSSGNQSTSPVLSVPFPGPVVFVASNQLIDPFDSEVSTATMHLMGNVRAQSPVERPSAFVDHHLSPPPSSSLDLGDKTRSSSVVDLPALIDLGPSSGQEIDQPRSSSPSDWTRSQSLDEEEAHKTISLMRFEQTESFEPLGEESRGGRASTPESVNKWVEEGEQAQEVRGLEMVENPFESDGMSHCSSLDQDFSNIDTDQPTDDPFRHDPSNDDPIQAVDHYPRLDLSSTDENWSDLGSETFESI